MRPTLQTPVPWAPNAFAFAPLGDLRRTQRLVKIATPLAASPGGTLPQAFPDWAELKAAGRRDGKPPSALVGKCSRAWRINWGHPRAVGPIRMSSRPRRGWAAFWPANTMAHPAGKPSGAVGSHSSGCVKEQQPSINSKTNVGNDKHSQPAGSPFSKPADQTTVNPTPIEKSAIRQVWKPALPHSWKRSKQEETEEAEARIFFNRFHVRLSLLPPVDHRLLPRAS
jgi:hypothetical protein